MSGWRVVGRAFCVYLMVPFLYADVVLVVGWDSVVVEGWSSGFLVGLVFVWFGQGGDFGECVLTEVLLLGDFSWIVRLLRFRVGPPLDHCSLSFPRA